MSAIGSYVRMTRQDLDRCLDLAGRVRTETSGKWFWKKTLELGRDEFENAWNAALLEEVDFDHSGYALSDYFTAQEEINNLTDHPFDSPQGRVLSSIFTAGFPVTTPTTFPSLPESKLRAFCSEEYGPEDAANMYSALMAAHEFYGRGIAALRPGEAVVFIVS